MRERQVGILSGHNYLVAAGIVSLAAVRMVNPKCVQYWRGRIRDNGDERACQRHQKARAQSCFRQGPRCARSCQAGAVDRRK